MSQTKEATGNILLVANWESNVGYAWWLMENFWAAIQHHFSPYGIHSHLVYPRITTIPAHIKDTEITTHELDFSDHGINGITRLYKLIKRHDIRYIYLSDASTYSWFYLLLRLFGIRKIIVHDHTPGDRTEARGMNRWLKSLVQRIPCYTADHFIAVTDFVYQRFLKVNCIPESKCSVAANGIQPFDLSATDENYAHRLFNIPSNATIVVNTGRASFYKGIDFLIRCAEKLVNEQHNTDLYFIFCGDGPDIDAFENLSRELKLEKNFIFAGKRSDIRQILPSCDIGFHASQGEVGYSLSILEYMSAGLVTIVPDRPSTALATRHDYNGLVYKARDISSACEAIKRSLDPALRYRLKNNAIESVKKKFNITMTNQRLLENMDKIILQD